jgi:hypothetical protein
MTKKTIKSWFEKDSLDSLIAKTKELSKGAWTGAIVTANQFSDWAATTEWMDSINKTYTNAITKAMDAGYKIGAKDLETGLDMSANNHRILDGGHTLSESFKRATEHVESEGGSAVEGYLEWAKAYISDLSSTAGMPAPFAEEIYGFLRRLPGIDESTARDFVTVNGQEAMDALFGGTITLLAVVFEYR